MNTYYLLLLLPVVAASGWYYGRKQFPGRKSHSSQSMPEDYFVGLNYLINEQPDKAVDVFIKMLDVNSDTFETHLALGSLFRRRGEVDRAIRIHQNLLARPQLNREQRIQALLELGQNYLRAGLLDRAEGLFLQLLDMDPASKECLLYLLNIYQQQKDWEQAIVVAQKLKQTGDNTMQIAISHYYCELAEYAKEKNSLEQMQNYLTQALAADRNCVRASILQGALETIKQRHRQAIRCYQEVKNQDPDYISEVIAPLAHCYEQLGEQRKLIAYLQKCLMEYPRISVILTLANYLRQTESDRVAIEFMVDQIYQYPSLRGVQHLLQIYLDNSYGDARQKLQLLHDLILNLLTEKPVYRCSHCGFSAKTLYWQCPRCRHWNTVKPIHGLEGD